MINTIELYNDTVIKPLEIKRNEIRKKAYDANIFRGYYLNVLEKYEKLLYEKYSELGKIIKEEYYID